MADLVAQGPHRQDRWRRSLPPGQPIVLGRSAGSWSVPWDDRISRHHVQLLTHADGVEVRVLPSATNPVFYRGHRRQQFVVRPGESFVIGETTFSVSDEEPRVSADFPVPVSEQTFSLQYLRSVDFRQSQRRIDVLSRLPELVGHAASDEELFVHLTNVLLGGIAKAEAVAVVEGDPRGNEPARILHWDRARLSSVQFEPSERLIREALRRRESVLHVWQADSASEFTARADIDWAFCTPVSGPGASGWAIYVAGRNSGPASPARATDPFDLRDDLKFTELVASLVGSLQHVRFLQRRQASLSQFFSPIVVQALANADPETVLVPREADVAVLFCDLRGFSRRSEQADDLMGLLERVSQVLGVMTHHILAEGGVVGDFHGDAAMGFWGWPLPQADRVARACRAALRIRQQLEEAASRPKDPLANFRVGMGIASGKAVAGKIGSEDQVKVTVFGPVVNLAARLEAMTKVLRTPILIDSATAAEAQRMGMKESSGGASAGDQRSAGPRVRRVAVVRPAGMQRPVHVSELLPPEAEFPQLSDQHIADYERGLDALLQGDWSQALEFLHRVPASDQVKDFLTVFIAQNNRTPPENWDGVIPIDVK